MVTKGRWFAPGLAVTYGSLYFLSIMAVHLLCGQPALGHHRELLVASPCFGMLMSLGRLDAKLKGRSPRH